MGLALNSLLLLIHDLRFEPAHKSCLLELVVDAFKLVEERVGYEIHFAEANSRAHTNFVLEVPVASSPAASHLLDEASCFYLNLVELFRSQAVTDNLPWKLPCGRCDRPFGIRLSGPLSRSLAELLRLCLVRLLAVPGCSTSFLGCRFHLCGFVKTREVLVLPLFHE